MILEQERDYQEAIRRIKEAQDNKSIPDTPRRLRATSGQASTHWLLRLHPLSQVLCSFLSLVKYLKSANLKSEV